MFLLFSCCRTCEEFCHLWDFVVAWFRFLVHCLYYICNVGSLMLGLRFALRLALLCDLLIDSDLAVDFCFTNCCRLIYGLKSLHNRPRDTVENCTVKSCCSNILNHGPDRAGTMVYWHVLAQQYVRSGFSSQIPPHDQRRQ